MTRVLTTTEMRDLLATLLEGAAGGTHQHWLEAIGAVEHLPIHFNIHCNWRVHPHGSASDLAAIEKAVELVRAEHHYVVP